MIKLPTVEQVARELRLINLNTAARTVAKIRKTYGIDVG